MRFTSPVSSVRKAVSFVRDIVPSRSVSRESSGVLVEAFNGKVVFSASGGDMVMKVSIPADVSEEGSAVVGSAMFSNVVSSFTPFSMEEGTGTKEIDFRINAKTKSVVIESTTTYKGGGKVANKRTVPLLNSEFFPQLPKYNSKESFRFPGQLFKESLDKTLYAVRSSEDGDPLSGIFVKASGGRYTAVATDGVKLAEYSCPVDPSVEFQAILPSKFAAKVAKSIDPTEDINILFSKSIFWVSSPGVLIGGSVLVGTYPDYKSLLKPTTGEAVVDKKVLLDNVRNLDFMDIEDNRMTMKFGGGKLSTFTEVARNDDIPTSFDGTFEVDFNVKLLKSSLQVCDGDSVFVKFLSSASPVFFFSSGVEGKGVAFNSMLVPLNR